jgi:hypothetical protein
MTSEFKYLEDALANAIKEKEINPNSSRIEAVIDLAEIEKSKIKLALQTVHKLSLDAAKVIEKNPFLKAFTRDLYGDLDGQEQRAKAAIKDLDELIKKAEEAETE